MDTDLYKKSIELVALCDGMSRRLPQRMAFLGDQLTRASASVTLSFSEGSGRATPAERRRSFAAARSSTREIMAAIDVGARLRVIDDDDRARGLRLADDVATLLTRLC